MANAPIKSEVSAPVLSDMDKIMAVLASKPATGSKISAATAMAMKIAKAKGENWDSMTTGQKAFRTRRVKDAAKEAGVTL